MNLPYIINVAVILLACLAFYKLLLHRETFYKVNRYMLIVCLMISFALPLLEVPAEFSLRKSVAIIENGKLKVESEKQQANDNSAASNINEQKNNPANVSQPSTSNIQPSTTGNQPQTSNIKSQSILSWLFWIYWFGVIVFGVSFLFQLVLLLVRAHRNPVIIDGKYRIVEVSGDKAPCSFGNNIFINPAKYEWETYNQIIEHEKVHIRQNHTLDIIIAELLLIFQWFNPFAWIYRREIESNLEFLTDDQLLQQKIDKQSYQLSLMKVSAPHFPLSLTTNYNQSILKKRIAMMNKKRSNLHTAWKYFFLLPVFAFLACLLNEPMAYGQTNEKNKENAKNERENEKNAEKNSERGMQAEGYWFAVIKDDKVNIRFSDEKMESENWDFKKGHSFNGTTFKLSELGTLPKGVSGTFNINREAGKMEMTGKFEGNTGMGTYKFVADKAYVDFMNKELKETLDEDEQMAFFFINIRKEFLTMLRSEGYKDVTKDDLIPVAALGIDKAYISSIRNAGFKEVSLENLVPLKALGIDEKYIAEIRSAGYKDISPDQLVSFKAQGIDKKYIESVRQMKGDKGDKGDKGGKDDDADDIVSFKAMNITPEYINSFKAVGLTNIPNEQLVAFKAVGVTPEYVKGWYDMGFKNIDADEFVGMKSQNVTPEYMKSFTALGYKDIKPEDLVAFRALGITPDYVKSFEAAGYKVTDLDNLTGLKAQGITPEFIKSFESVGFKNIDLDEILAVKAMGVTPEYIKEMRSKGFNYDKLQKYVTLKSID
ncbi:MAG TPA: M56 family metallopeptidase, partial [Chitinophagaceae bacterium]